MSYSIAHSKKDGYKVSVKAHGKSVNTWSLGHDEAVAKGRVGSILDAYANGLEFTQEQVREIFAKEEDDVIEVEEV